MATQTWRYADELVGIVHWRNYATCETCAAAAGFACHDLRSSPRAPYPTTVARPHRGRLNVRIARSREAFATGRGVR